MGDGENPLTSQNSRFFGPQSRCTVFGEKQSVANTARTVIYFCERRSRLFLPTFLSPAPTYTVLVPCLCSHVLVLPFGHKA